MRLHIRSIPLLIRFLLDRSFDFVKNKLHMDSFLDNYETTSGAILSDKDYSALALGGMNYGVTLLEITAAYQIFPNSGVYNTPHTILQIRDKQGNVIVNNDIESEVVISDQTATIMTKLLQNVVTSGTASSITLKNRVNVAGRPRTTVTVGLLDIPHIMLQAYGLAIQCRRVSAHSLHLRRLP